MRKKPFTKKMVESLRKVLADRPRDLTLLNFGIDTCLRSQDLLSLRVSTIKTEWGELRETFDWKQGKTNRPVRCQLSKSSLDAFLRWIDVTEKETEDFIFTSVRGGNKPISTKQMRRIIDGWCEEMSWDRNYFGAHSLRKAIPHAIYLKSRDLASCRILLGHKNLQNTSAYLGVEENDCWDAVRQFGF
ncbi:MAG: hypothetical protein CL661_12255 [Bacteroidetes bacterium]|nr:hypothetical protein [Bacteroidota bacterium]